MCGKLVKILGDGKGTKVFAYMDFSEGAGKEKFPGTVLQHGELSGYPNPSMGKGTPRVGG